MMAVAEGRVGRGATVTIHARYTSIHMPPALHGKTCTLLLFEQPGGEIEALFLLDGTIAVTGMAVSLVPLEAGDVVRIPPHLIDDIEPVSEEHRACIEDIKSEYCLRAFYDGRLGDPIVDLSLVLANSTGPSSAR